MTDIQQHALLILLWTVWCGLHSLLIAPGFTFWVNHHWKASERFYRLVYNAFAVISLVPVWWYGTTIESTGVWMWRGPWRMGQALLIVSALYLFRAGSRGYDLRVMLGLHQLRDDRTDACDGIGANCSLSEAGILGRIRHPWYTAGMLIVWARDWTWSTIGVNLVLTLYFVLGTYWEERKLIRQFGGAYADYQKRVPMFFPRILKR